MRQCRANLVQTVAYDNEVWPHCPQLQTRRTLPQRNVVQPLNNNNKKLGKNVKVSFSFVIYNDDDDHINGQMVRLLAN